MKKLLPLLIASALHAMEPKPPLKPFISVAHLMATKQIPALTDGDLDLTHCKLESLEGLEEYELRDHMVRLFCNHNQLRSLPPSLPRHLVVLDLTHNPLDALPPTLLNGLLLLSKFTMRSTCIKEVPPHFFDDLPRLKDINLSNNQISELDPQLFRIAAQLERLNLNRNAIMSLDSCAFLFQSDLRVLRLAGNKIRFIPMMLFFALSKLETLDLSNNEITHFDRGTFDDMPQLCGLYLVGNQLKALKPSLLHQCPNLTELNLQDNELDTLCPTIIEPLTALRALNLRHNHPKLMHNLPMRTIELIESRSIFIGDSLYGQSPDERTLEEHVSTQHARGHFDQVYGEHPQKEGLYVVNLAHQGLSSLAKMQHLLPAPEMVTEMYLRNNNLKELPIEAFNRFSNLEFLEISHNQIESLESNQNTLTHEPEVLCLPSLHTLHASDNAIRFLSNATFSKMTRLVTLSLSRNVIHYIDDQAFRALPHLEHLFLEHNQLEGIPSTTFNPAPHVTDNLAFIDLSHNCLGGSTYHFPPTTVLRMFPQDPQPLKMRAARCMVSNLQARKQSDQFAELEKLPSVVIALIAHITPHELRQIIELDYHVKQCQYAFETDDVHGAYQEWLNIFNHLIEQNWNDGINLFFERFQSHHLHQRFLANWIAHQLKELQEATLCALANQLIRLPRTLFHVCIEQAPLALQLRIQSAQEVHRVKQEITHKWFEMKQALLIANMKKTANEESPQKTIEAIQAKWQAVIDELKTTFDSWQPEMQNAFFELCGEKLRRELLSFFEHN